MVGNRSKAKKVALMTILFNGVLGIIKVVIGLLGKSSVLVADGIHSFSDLITTVGVLIGLRIAKEEPDECHPYGHEKIESAIAIILSAVIMVTAFYISFQALTALVNGQYNVPHPITIYIAIIAIVSKEIMFWYTIKVGKQIKSPMLVADAWHHHGDALSSIAALIGILANIHLGWHFIEHIATLIIGIVIIKISISIYLQSVREVIDQSADEQIIDSIYVELNNIRGICQIDDVKTRIHVNKIFVEVEIAVDKNVGLVEAHDIAEEVHDNIESISDKIQHCVVHVNPF